MTTTAITVPLEQLTEEAVAYAEESHSANTKRAYRSDWIHFTEWCNRFQLEALPAQPETVVLYIANMASQFRPSTIQRRMTTITRAHRSANLQPPTHFDAVRRVWRGIKRKHGSAQRQVSPISPKQLKRMIRTLPKTLAGKRDKALLVIGFAGAFRRSELVGLDVDDITVIEDGLVVTIRRSKTDQEGEGRQIGIPRGHGCYCPVTAYQAWVKASDIADGPLFRAISRHGHLAETRLTPRAVALIIKRAAIAINLDPTHYAGHSLRAGLATAAAQAGVCERDIMKQTGHRSERMVRRYIRDGGLFRDNAASSLL